MTLGNSRDGAPTSSVSMDKGVDAPALSVLPHTSKTTLYTSFLSPVTRDFPLPCCTNDLMFPFPPSEAVTWDFPLLSWTPRAQTLCPPQDPATPPATSPTPSYQLLQAAISLGKTWPCSFQCFMKLALVSWGKNAFICPGFPIRQPFYCSPPSCIFFPL